MYAVPVMSHTSSSSDEKPLLAIGGQALMEGVMMRSPRYYTMAVRRSNKEIVVEARRYISWTKRSRLLALPILRGMVVLGESLYLGMSALFFSNKILMEDLEEEAKTTSNVSKAHTTKIPTEETAFQRFYKGLFLVLYLLFAFGLAIFLFKFLPLWVAESVKHYSALVAREYWLFNLIDGLTKMAIFLGYILLISLMPDVRRVFAYHGAEHQAIWAYEKRLPLTIKNAQSQHPEHPRCGTSFIALVLLLSVVVYTVLPSHAEFMVKFLERLAVLPLIAGLSYEVLKFSAKYEHHWAVQWITIPGMLFQKITTKKPDDEMEEVAIKALEAALEAEQSDLA
ncbi:MAG: hypothetical protein ACD_28C00364G0009 [uncultured bacterium]|nr:MAG: hypothetical protein ACD_28C00364G0009 [uncultured bacterium]